VFTLTVYSLSGIEIFDNVKKLLIVITKSVMLSALANAIKRPRFATNSMLASA